MGRPEQIQFFVTSAHECSYLNNQQATAIFADPYSIINQDTFATLTEMGFRRSGDYIYKPRCLQCRACVPVRVPVKDFQKTRSQKRIWKKNEDLTVVVDDPSFQEADYQLYEKYINIKHQDGGMHPPTPTQFKSFLFCRWSSSKFIRFFLAEQLIAVAVVDQLPRGLSAVYTFYDPDFDSRSLGTSSILWQIQWAQQSGIDYLYLGYWIRNCRKMAYKNQFTPFEQFIDEQWILFKSEVNESPATHKLIDQI